MIEDRWTPSPNHSSRNGAWVRYVILHADASPREAATVSWIARPESQVSYHVLVHRDGTSTRFVRDDRNAWHAGRSAWEGLTGLNRWSLGLAFANRNDGREALTPEQIAAGLAWCRYWALHYPTLEGILTHAMVSPGRKSDPETAPNFDLSTFQAVL
jgi:N-acetylmuramoyl-L-alanine amidase